MPKNKVNLPVFVYSKSHLLLKYQYLSMAHLIMVVNFGMSLLCNYDTNMNFLWAQHLLQKNDHLGIDEKSYRLHTLVINYLSEFEKLPGGIHYYSISLKTNPSKDLTLMFVRLNGYCIILIQAPSPAFLKKEEQI